MTQIRVNPTSVQAYGTRAQEIFDAIHSELQLLVTNVVAVHYYGENSVQFKRQCGVLAADFAATMHRQLADMASAVSTSTQAIASSLGGHVVRLEVAGKTITPAEPAVVDYVDVETTALEGLSPTVAGHFTALRQQLADHLSALIGTDWTGNAKDSATQAVGSLTTSASGSCDTAQQSITTFITQQLESVVSADV